MMNADISKICSDTDFNPKHVVLYCTTTHDWLFPQLMEVLRAKFDTKFTLISSIHRKKHHESFLSEKDSIRVIEDFDVSLKATNPNEKLDVEHVLTLANHFQRKYGLHYLRDIIQQDRSKLPLLFNGVGISKSEVANNDGLIHEANLINKSFKYIENFFQENGEIDFVLIRPADYSSVAICAVCNAKKSSSFFFSWKLFQPWCSVVCRSIHGQQDY